MQKKSVCTVAQNTHVFNDNQLLLRITMFWLMTLYILAGSTNVSQDCAPPVLVVFVFYRQMILENKETKHFLMIFMEITLNSRNVKIRSHVENCPKLQNGISVTLK
jgi:hypothetical protein